MDKTRHIHNTTFPVRGPETFYVMGFGVRVVPNMTRDDQPVFAVVAYGGHEGQGLPAQRPPLIMGIGEAALLIAQIYTHAEDHGVLDLLEKQVEHERQQLKVEEVGAAISALDLGRIAYQGYATATGYRSMANGAPLPTWERLPDPTRHAWAHAAAHVWSALAELRDGDGDGDQADDVDQAEPAAGGTPDDAPIQ